MYDPTYWRDCLNDIKRVASMLGVVTTEEVINRLNEELALERQVTEILENAEF